MKAQTFSWGTEVRRGNGPIPFLQYSPRRHHVSEFIEDVERWRDRVHLVQGSRRLTFGEVFEASDRVAGKLAETGVRRKDRLLLLAPNSPEWVIALWAGIRAGAIEGSPRAVAHRNRAGTVFCDEIHRIAHCAVDSAGDRCALQRRMEIAPMAHRHRLRHRDRGTVVSA